MHKLDVYKVKITQDEFEGVLQDQRGEDTEENIVENFVKRKVETIVSEIEKARAVATLAEHPEAIPFALAFKNLEEEKKAQVREIMDLPGDFEVNSTPN